MTKAKKKAKGTAKKKSSPKKSNVKAKKEVDFVKVRQNIADLVGGSAKEIFVEVIKAAKLGQLAPAKYVFEAVGLYPPTEETMARPGDSLGHLVLKSLGLPTEPVGGNEGMEAKMAGSGEGLGGEKEEASEGEAGSANEVAGTGSVEDAGQSQGLD